jgi:LmbE family N-acetylglucosaminyl deacetylase
MRALIGRTIPGDVFRHIRVMLKMRDEPLYPQLIEKPAARCVLVLSPHPDDDVITCGGTLVKHHRAGDHITSVYLTDGRKGDPAWGDEADLVRERRAETEQAARIIGIDRLVFLGEPDLELRVHRELVRRLSSILDEARPDIVYLPFMLDFHPDHRAANALFVAVCRRGTRVPRVLAYEAWTPLMPNRIVDITREMPVKCEAIEQHRTQTKNIEYVRLVKGLNAYRTLHAPRECAYAEAFFEARTEEYAGLWDHVERGRS